MKIEQFKEYLELSNKQKEIVQDNHTQTIVPAGAGAGKTKTLAVKIVKLINEGVSLDNLLVLTFTNKAALEMKNRIKKFLKEFPNLAHLANKVDSASIETFDAFSLNFVKQNANFLKKDPNIDLVDPAIFKLIKYEQMYQLVLKQLEASLDEINYFADLVDKVGNDNLVKNLLELYDKLTGSYVFEELNAEFFTIPPILIDLDTIRNDLQTISNDLYLLNEAAIETRLTYLNKLLKNQVTPYQTISYKWKQGGESVDPRNKNLFEKKLKSELNQFIKHQITADDLSEYNHFINQYQMTTRGLLMQFHQQIKQFKEASNKFEFVDIASLVVQTLKNEPSILMRVRDQYRYVFIDEYQDTSNIQHEFLELLIKDNEQVKVLYVGDIKQSIYKFRNANPAKFIEKQNEAINLALNTNYRSAPAIIKFINQMFNQILTDEVRHDIVYQQGHEMIPGSQKFNNDPFAGVYLLKYQTDKKSDSVEEAFVIGNKIKQLVNDPKQQVKLSDCTILLRDGTDFGTYQDVFKHLGIPIQVQYDLSLKSNYFFKLMSNLLLLAKDYQNPKLLRQNRRLYYSVVKSELFQLSDGEIFADLIDKTTRKPILNLDKIIEPLTKLNQLIKTKTNFEIIDQLITLFSVKTAILSAYDYQLKLYVIDFLYSLAWSLSDLDYLGDRFVEFINQVANDNSDLKIKVLQETTENSVKITNIHQSKGLEYQVLFVGKLDKSLKSKPRGGSLEYASETGFVYQSDFDYTNKPKLTEISKFVRQQAKDVMIASDLKEQLRLLYVALTRAERMLFLVQIDREDEGLTNSFADYLKQAGMESVIEPQRIEVLPQGVKVVDYYKSLTEQKMYYPAQFNQAKVDFKIHEQFVRETQKASINLTGLIDQKQKQSLNYGTQQHLKFEYTNFKTLASSKDSDLVRLGTTKFNQRLIADAQEVLTEFEFFDEEAELRGSIDLLVIYSDEIHIIDYKIKNVDRSKYEKQILAYRDYVTKLYPHLMVHAYLYAILTGKVELIS